MQISIYPRSSPRPAYARGFGGLGLGPPKLLAKAESGDPGTIERRVRFVAPDSRLSPRTLRGDGRGNERNMDWNGEGLYFGKAFTSSSVRCTLLMVPRTKSRAFSGV